MSEYILVADADSLPPGQGRTVNVRGREFALYNHDGQFYALDDLCPHRGGPLGAGALQDGCVFCPLHGWGFDLKTGACTTGGERGVRVYPTREVEGRVEICV